MVGAIGRPPERSVRPEVLLGSFERGVPDPLHELIRAARAGHRAAITRVRDHVRQRADLVALGADDLIVPVPGHRAGSVTPLVLAVVGELCLATGGRSATASLWRRRDAPAAKVHGHTDAGTLVWRPPEGGRAIVLVDDVYRTGSTVDACVTAIRRAGDRREVRAVVLARVRS